MSSRLQQYFQSSAPPARRCFAQEPEDLQESSTGERSTSERRYYAAPPAVQTAAHPLRSALIGAAPVGIIGAVGSINAKLNFIVILFTIITGIIVGSVLGLLLSRLIKPGAFGHDSSGEQGKKNL